MGGWPTDFELFEQFVQYWRDGEYGLSVGWEEDKAGFRRRMSVVSSSCTHLSTICPACVGGAAAAVLFQQSRPLIRILRGHLRHADIRAMHRAVSVILCRTSARVPPFDAITWVLSSSVLI